MTAGLLSQRIGFVLAFSVFWATVGAAAASEIPVGSADDNTATSRGLTEIFQKCEQVHRALEYFHARGHHVYVRKRRDSPVSHEEAQFRVTYQKPGRLAVISESTSSDLNGAFVANGTTVTMAWNDEDSSGIKNFYKMVRQPDSLAQFTDVERKGELLLDWSERLSYATNAQLIVSEDFFGNDTGSRTFFYEGIDAVAGEDCHRVRVHETNPEMHAIWWIDTGDSMIRKASFIYSYDENLQAMESFADGVFGSMHVVTWETVTTSPEAVDTQIFGWTPPSQYEPYRADDGESADDDSQPGFWESLVASAARASDQPTSRSLSTYAGPLRMRLEAALTVPDDFQLEHLALSPVRMPCSNEQAMAMASRDGKITVRDGKNREITSLTLGMKISHFDTLESTSGELLQFIVCSDDEKSMMGFSPEGRRLWTYGIEDFEIEAMQCGAREPYIYAIVNGLRKIDQNGQVVYATINGQEGNLITPIEGADRVILRYTYAVDVLDKRLRWKNQVTADEIFVTTRWDTKNPDAPMMNLMATAEERDILVQRRREDGTVVWTATVGTRLTDVQSGGLVWANLLVEGEVRRCLLTAVSTGHVLVVSPEGNVLYRGQVTADPATIKRNDDTVIVNMELADMDGDGVDEFYALIESELMRLVSY